MDHRPDEAVSDVGRIVGLSRLIERDPALLSCLVGLAMLHYASETIHFLLDSAGPLDPAHLEALRAVVPTAIEVSNALKAERVFGLHTFLPLTDSGTNAQAEAAFGMNPGEARMTAATGVFLQDHLAFLRTTGAVIDAVTNGFPSALLIAREIERGLKRQVEETSEALATFQLHKLGSIQIFTSMSFPIFIKALNRAATVLAELRMTHLALLLEEERAATGQYPADLDSLRDSVPNDMLIDPFSGSGLRYIPDQLGFILYSVGEDGTDEGGKPREKALASVLLHYLRKDGTDGGGKPREKERVRSEAAFDIVVRVSRPAAEQR